MRLDFNRFRLIKNRKKLFRKRPKVFKNETSNLLKRKAVEQNKKMPIDHLKDWK